MTGLHPRLHGGRPSCRFLRLSASLVLLPALALGGCRGEDAPLAPRPLSVTSEPARVERFGDVVDTVSTLEALEEVQLAAQAGGRIERLLVRQGDPVRQGELLLVLDQTQARADVARLRAEMETRLLNYRRFEFLARQGAASTLQRDEYRQQYISTRQELIAREADLAFRDLRSPINGIVGDVQVKVGDVIQAGTPFTRIIRNDRLTARVDVPAVYGDRVRVGLPVILTDPATDRPIARSTVRSVDPGVVAGSQSLLAKAEFENPAGTLRNGLRTRTRLVLDVRDQLSVPFAAVTQTAGQSFVFTVGTLADLQRRPGKADLQAAARLPASTTFALQTPVRLGPLQNNRYPVLSGLNAGEEVITSNLINLRHGIPVRAGAASAPEAPPQRAGGAR